MNKECNVVFTFKYAGGGGIQVESKAEKKPKTFFWSSISLASYKIKMAVRGLVSLLDSPINKT